jgi:hypothetical protein
VPLFAHVVPLKHGLIGTEQVTPEYHGGHKHTNCWIPSIHVALDIQGFDAHLLICTSQFVPVYDDDGQIQVYPLTWFRQRPLIHGELAQ